MFDAIADSILNWFGWPPLVSNFQHLPACGEIQKWYDDMELDSSESSALLVSEAKSRMEEASKWRVAVDSKLENLLKFNSAIAIAAIAYLWKDGILPISLFLIAISCSSYLCFRLLTSATWPLGPHIDHLIRLRDKFTEDCRSGSTSTTESMVQMKLAGAYYTAAYLTTEMIISRSRWFDAAVGLTAISPMLLALGIFSFRYAPTLISG